MNWLKEVSNSEFDISPDLLYSNTMNKFLVEFPNTNRLSAISYRVSDKYMESKEEEALWHYNRSRDHDRLPPLNELPEGVIFTEIFD